MRLSAAWVRWHTAEDVRIAARVKHNKMHILLAIPQPQKGENTVVTRRRNWAVPVGLLSKWNQRRVLTSRIGRKRRLSVKQRDGFQDTINTLGDAVVLLYTKDAWNT